MDRALRNGTDLLTSGFSYSASFPGLDNNRIDFGYKAAFDMSATMTVEYWIKPEVQPSSTHGGIIFNKEHEYEASIWGDGMLKWAIQTDNGSTWIWIDTGYYPEVRKWTHIAITFNLGIVKTYVNGSLIHTYYGTGNIKKNSTNQSLWLGDRPAVSNQHYKGLIQDFRLWNVVRTQQQIKDNMRATALPDTTGLVDRWELNHDSGTTVTALKGNEGTTNGTSWVINSAIKALLTSRSKQPYDYTMVLKNDSPKVNDINIPLQDHTISFWIKPHKLTNYNQRVGSSNGWGSFFFHSGSGGAVWAGNFNGGDGSRFTINELPNGTLNVNEKAHCTFTYEYATKVAKFYKNGKLLATKTFVNHPNALPGFKVGSDVDDEFDITDVRFYSTLKSGTQVHDIFKGKEDKSGLEIWWKMQGNHLDYSGNGRHGSATGNQPFKLSEFPSLINRSSLSYDGVDDKIVIPSDTRYKLQTLSIEFWVYPIDNGLRHCIVTTWYGFTTEINSTGVFKFGLNGLAGQYYGTKVLPWNKWTHVTSTYDSATGEQAVYFNGDFMESQIQKGTINYTAGADLIFSGDWDNHTGGLANVRIWDKALSSSEIKQNMYRYLPAETPGLVEQWKMDEGIGGTVYGTKGLNGTITGAIWKEPTLANWRSGHVKFDGVDDFIEIGTIPFKGDYTLEGWFNISSDLTERAILNSYVGTRGTNSVYMEIGSDHKARFVHRNPASGLGGVNVYSTALSPGVWTHLAFTKGADGIMRIYVNGSLNASATESVDKITEDAEAIIGKLGGSAERCFSGGMDEFRIWNAALTQEEIQANMYRTLERHPNLKAYWRFDHDGFWDASGNGNHGTPLGGPVIEDNDNEKLHYNAPIND